VIVVCLALKSPYEAKVSALYRAHKMGGTTFASKDVRQQVTQMMFVAVLSGFRGVISNFIWISAHMDFQQERWVRMKEKMLLSATLQPYSVQYWSTAAWHFGWNTSYAATVDEKLTEVERERNRKVWYDMAQDTYLKGISFNSDTYKLYADMGHFLKEKEKNPAGSAKYYHLAAKQPDAPLFIFRQEAYAVYEAGDRAKAYRMFRELWNNPLHRVPTISTRIRELETELAIPQGERLTR